MTVHITAGDLCMVLNMYTLHYCILVEDLERNNGQDKPYFMSKKLMKLLNVKNKTESSSGQEVEMSRHAK